MSDLISKPTRRAFQEAWVSTTLRAIANDFDDANIAEGTIPDGVTISGERRTLVERYYRSIDWSSPAQTARVFDAYTSLLARLETTNSELYARLVKALERDRLRLENGRVVRDAHEPVLEELVDKVIAVDLAQLRVNIQRIRGAIEEDPALAIGSSKELVEATCKAILMSRKVTFSPGADIPDLVSAVAKELNLVASKVTDATKGAQSIKRVLGSLANTVQGLAELRNLYGSGHGKAPGQRGLGARHARLCAGAASTLATFLMETAAEKVAKP
jgi:hypothetical protein